MEQYLEKQGMDAQNGITWFLAAITQGRADDETLLEYCRNLKIRLDSFGTTLAQFQDELEREQLAR